MNSGEINYLAVIIAAVVNMGLGFFWYSTAGFGKEWMKLSGISSKDINDAKNKGMNMTYFLGMVTSIVMVYVLAHVLNYVNATNIVDGALTGFWMWLGFVMPVQISGFLYESKPFKLFAINTGYYLAALIVDGVLLSLWR